MLALAWAGATGDVLVERSRVALTEERFVDAREHALEALRTDPEAWAAWRLYLRASKATGLDDVARAELQASDDIGAAIALSWWTVSQREAPPSSLDSLDDPRARIAKGWTLLARGDTDAVLALDLPAGAPLATRLRLRALAAAGRTTERDQLALSWLRDHPRHPDVLAELFVGGQGRVEGAKGPRKRVLRTLRAQIDEADARWLLLALRTFVAASDEASAQRIADRLEAQGLARPLTRSPWGGPMRRAMGRALSGYETIELPEASAAELDDLVASMAERLLSHDRARDASEAWAVLRRRHDSVSAALGHARALRAAGEPKRAERALDEATALLLAPWRDDPCGRRLDRRLRAAEQVAREAGDARRPPPALLAAAEGDRSGWRALATDPMLSWCLAAQDGAPPDVAGPFLHPATAAEVLASAARQQPVTPPPAPAPVAPRLPAKGEVFPPVPLPVAAGSVEALRGTPVVVTLWASWCQPCRKELPELAASMQRLRGEGHAVEWLALSVDEHEAAYRRAAQRLPLDGAQVGRRPELLADLAVGEVPTTWVVGPDGRVRLVRSGYSEQLCTQVEQAVEGER